MNFMLCYPIVQLFFVTKKVLSFLVKIRCPTNEPSTSILTIILFVNLSHQGNYTLSSCQPSSRLLISSPRDYLALCLNSFVENYELVPHLFAWRGVLGNNSPLWKIYPCCNSLNISLLYLHIVRRLFMYLNHCTYCFSIINNYLRFTWYQPNYSVLPLPKPILRFLLACRHNWFFFFSFWWIYPSSSYSFTHD